MRSPPAHLPWLPALAIDQLAEQGFCSIPGFASRSLTQKLAAEARLLDRQQRFHSAAIGRGLQQTINPEIRGDRICWLEHGLTTASSYLQRMEQVRQQLNRELFLGLSEFEAHYALYPAGSFYKRHLDRHRSHPARTISSVLYLNNNWPEQAGGELLAWLPDGSTRKILPEAGLLVLFRSDTIYHEVQETRRLRLSLTGWFRTST